MKRNKLSISQASSYVEIGEFWSSHELTDFEDKLKPAVFEVDIQSEKRYYPVERDLANQITEAAQRRGVAAETLLNLWIKEKLLEQKT